MARTGSNAYVIYGTETAFGTPVSRVKALGYNVHLSPLRFINNQMPVPDLNNAEIVKFAYGQNEGSFSANWVLSNPWFLELLFGQVTDGGATPYTHTYAVPAAKTVKSATFEVGEQLQTANSVRTISGCVLNSARLSSSINNLVKVDGDFLYGIADTVGTSLAGSPATDDIAFPYTFVHGSLSAPTTSGTYAGVGAGASTTIAELDSIELSIAQNAKLVYGHNSANAVGAYREQMVYTGRFSASKVDSTQLNLALNRAEANNAGSALTLTLVFSNGLTTTNERSITFTGTGVGISEHSEDVIPTQRILDNVVWQIRTMSVVAKNNTQNSL